MLNCICLFLDDEADEDAPGDESPERPRKKKKSTKGKKKKVAEAHDDLAATEEEAPEPSIQAQAMGDEYDIYPAG